MPYKLKLVIYTSAWCIAGPVLAYQFNNDFSWPALLLIAITIGVAAVLTGRYFFTRNKMDLR